MAREPTIEPGSYCTCDECNRPEPYVAAACPFCAGDVITATPVVEITDSARCSDCSAEYIAWVDDAGDVMLRLLDRDEDLSNVGEGQL